MTQAIKNQIKKLLLRYPQKVIRDEYREQSFTWFNERPIEFSFVFRQLGKLYPKRILDVGTGKTALPHLMRNCGCLVTAIDNIRDYWPSDMTNRHYFVIDDDIRSPQVSQKVDMITCVSVLEHIEDHDAALRGMFSLLNPHGHIVLTCPYTESRYTKNVYDLPESSYGQSASYICQSYSRNELSRWLVDNNGVVIEQEYWQFWTGDSWTLGEQIVPPKKSSAEGKHQISCILIRKTS